MSKSINIVRKAKVKASILQGNSYKQALKDAGYSDACAHKSSQMGVVKVCRDEIKKEFQARSITVEEVLRRIDEDRHLAHAKGDISTALQADIALGKHLAMFTDKSEVKTSITQERQEELRRFARIGLS